jgi:HEAT repeat protein
MVVYFCVAPAMADGCFVFKWDKKIDINEPTQKAVILYDAGREDLLLQVKYEGPLQEFGWLIPVPSVPKVERSSMDAFYELSELTQRNFGRDSQGETVAMGLANGKGIEEPVKVIETKTVGAYEVAILSAPDAGGLDRWMKANGYSIPDGKEEIVNDYIRRGWFFVAAKIQLNGRPGFKLISPNGKDSAATIRTQASVQKKLATGELHPLLISFDTAKCIFLLRISAAAAKPSEVSLYVLSEQPLLSRPLFDESRKKLEQQYSEWEQNKKKYAGGREQSKENLRVLNLSFQMTPTVRGPDGSIQSRPDPQRKWTVKDLQKIVREGAPPPPPASIDDEFYVTGNELLHCLHIETNQIPKSSKGLPRLNDRSWYLTKVSRTFSSAEMQDLEFQPALPVLRDLLPGSVGRSAAFVLARFGADGASMLISAAQSGDPATRMNAVFGLEQVHDSRTVEPLLTLLEDTNPRVRLHAARAATINWDKRFISPMQKLFNDPYQDIRVQATACLSANEGRDRIPVYQKMANGSDQNVRWCALGVLQQLDRNAIPDTAIIRMLKDPNPEVQSCGLNLLWKLDRDTVPRQDLLPLLNSAWAQNIVVALKLIEGNGRVKPELPEPLAKARDEEERKRWLTSSEAILLTTNHLGEARMMGLRILERNADAKGIELMLPLLRDSNAVVQSQAFAVIKALLGQSVSDTDPAKWEQWWTVNKDSIKIDRR